MRTITIMSGLPGSGKTTWLAAYPHASDIVLHRDELRESLRAELGLAHTNQVPSSVEYQRWTELINRTLDENPNTNVYLDQTTLTQGSLNKLLKGILPHIARNDTVVIHRILTSAKICYERNAKRTGDARVPDEVMKSMVRSYERYPINKADTAKQFPDLFFAFAYDSDMEVENASH